MPSTPVRGLSPALVGLVLGTCAAIPLYLWQGSGQVAVAAFIIVGYTAFLWTHSYNHALMTAICRAELRAAPVNRMRRRLRRMLLDPGFWWTMLFGGAVVGGSVWRAGLTTPRAIAGVIAAWCVIAMCLRYGLTLVRPTRSCRRCGYDLTVQLAMSDLNQVVRCPECGAKWTRAQLGQVDDDARRVMQGRGITRRAA